jgi:hypothetical protein
MNLWRRGSLTSNPYYRTAFRVARVPKAVVSRRTMVQLIRQTQQVIARDPQAHTIGGRPVTEAELTAAQQVLLSPPRRVLEELLEHSEERLPLERVRQLAAEAAQAMAAAAGDEPLRVANLKALRPWARRWLNQFVENAAGADPAFGALELTPVPPFGRPESE